MSRTATKRFHEAIDTLTDDLIEVNGVNAVQFSSANALTLAAPLFIPKCQSTQLIYDPTICEIDIFALARHAAIARRNIQAWISCEEVAGPEQQRHRLSGHDGEVLW